MATLLIRLAGAMQSWGTISRFDDRDTGREPSKSGVLGILAAAMGIDRENWVDLEPLTVFRMGVRHDRPGIAAVDWQTAKDVAKGNGSAPETAVTKRHYLADAVFLVGIEMGDRALLERVQSALKDPVWTLCLGRKSYVPSEPIWIDGGIVDSPLEEALASHPWLSTPRGRESCPERLLLSMESMDGTGVLKKDQLLSSFSERRFGERFVNYRWIGFPREGKDAAA